MPSKCLPIVFIHGTWLHAAAWDRWVGHFRDAGYDPVAPCWPGVADTIREARKYPQDMAGVGIDIITDHYVRLVRALPEKPVVIGHCLGGLVAQKLLGRKLAKAAVAIGAVQPKGVRAVPFTQLRSILPVLRNPLNRSRAVTLTPGQFQAIFGGGISPAEAAELYWRWAIAAPGKPLFMAALAPLSPAAPTKVNIAHIERGPLLLIAGGKDRLAPSPVIRQVYNRYKQRSACITELKEFAGRGHSLTIDSGWKEIADYSLTWLRRHAV